MDHELDLSVFDARYRNDETGAAAYDPAVMLKIVLVGYARGLTSSRAIERACRENVVFMALSGDTQPHFTTSAAFVAKMPTEITAVFRDVLLVYDEQGLIGKELFAVDGCKLPSNASRSWSGTRAELTKKAEKMEKAIAHLLDAHQRQDAGETEDLLRKRERQQIETLKKNSSKIRRWLAGHGEKTNRKGQPLKSNLTDNDSASMKGSHGVIQGYSIAGATIWGALTAIVVFFGLVIGDFALSMYSNNFGPARQIDAIAVGSGYSISLDATPAHPMLAEYTQLVSIFGGKPRQGSMLGRVEIPAQTHHGAHTLSHVTASWRASPGAGRHAAW